MCVNARLGNEMFTVLQTIHNGNLREDYDSLPVNKTSSSKHLVSKLFRCNFRSYTYLD